MGLAAPTSAAILASRAGEGKGQVLSLSESLNNLTILVVLPIAAMQLDALGAIRAALVVAVFLAIGVFLAIADLATRKPTPP